MPRMITGYQGVAMVEDHRPRVQLLLGLDAPIDDRPRCRRRGKGISVSFAVGRQSRWRTTTRQSAPLRRIGTFGLAVLAACALYGAFLVKEFRHAGHLLH